MTTLQWQFLAVIAIFAVLVGVTSVGCIIVWRRSWSKLRGVSLD